VVARAEWGGGRGKTKQTTTQSQWTVSIAECRRKRKKAGNSKTQKYKVLDVKNRKIDLKKK